MARFRLLVLHLTYVLVGEFVMSDTKVRDDFLVKATENGTLSRTQILTTADLGFPQHKDSKIEGTLNGEDVNELQKKKIRELQSTNKTNTTNTTTASTVASSKSLIVSSSYFSFSSPTSGYLGKESNLPEAAAVVIVLGVIAVLVVIFVIILIASPSEPIIWYLKCCPKAKIKPKLQGIPKHGVTDISNDEPDTPVNKTSKRSSGEKRKSVVPGKKRASTEQASKQLQSQNQQSEWPSEEEKSAWPPKVVDDDPPKVGSVLLLVPSVYTSKKHR
jgi:hypothetical protein